MIQGLRASRLPLATFSSRLRRSSSVSTKLQCESLGAFWRSPSSSNEIVTFCIHQLDRELFRQFQLRFSQFETAAADISFGVQCQHDEVVLAEQAHQHHRAFERDDELSQATETGVSARPLRAAHERRELRSRHVEVQFGANLAQHLLDGNSIGSHYERTEAALGAFDNELKHLLEHKASNYGRWPLSVPGRAVVAPAGLFGVGALSNCG